MRIDLTQDCLDGPDRHDASGMVRRGAIAIARAKAGAASLIPVYQCKAAGTTA
jgi:hypothetical protein